MSDIGGIQDHQLTGANASDSKGTKCVLNVLIHRSHRNALEWMEERKEIAWKRRLRGKLRATRVCEGDKSVCWESKVRDQEGGCGSQVCV